MLLNLCFRSSIPIPRVILLLGEVLLATCSATGSPHLLPLFCTCAGEALFRSRPITIEENGG